MLSIFLEIDLALQDAPFYNVIGWIVAIDFFAERETESESGTCCYGVLISVCTGYISVVILANSAKKLDFWIPYWLDV